MRSKLLYVGLTGLLAALAIAGSVAVAPLAEAGTACLRNAPANSRRVVMYYQTQYPNNTYLSPLGLTQHNTRITDVIVGALHLDAGGVVHLNDDPPAATRYARMWKDLAAMQRRGVRVSVMLGGAARGTFTNLDHDFATYYPLLRRVIKTYGLDGVDLDVEETMSLAGIERVISALRSDFGRDFTITLAPVGRAMTGGGNLSGFDYDQLYRDRGAQISWFNVQLYNNWGSIANTADYEAIVNHGVVPAHKLVAGVLTNSANGGSGYVEPATVASVVRQLTAKYKDFGGVDGWEYFNSMPGGAAAPWQWAATMASAQGR